jgi:hypothetical protein
MAEKNDTIAPSPVWAEGAFVALIRRNCLWKR